MHFFDSFFESLENAILLSARKLLYERPTHHQYFFSKAVCNTKSFFERVEKKKSWQGGKEVNACFQTIEKGNFKESLKKQKGKVRFAIVRAN